MFNKITLDNGLRIVSSSMAQRQSLSIGIWINTGSRYENEKISGISHFLEHLVFKGTKNYTCQKIKESIEGVGGSFNGFTSEEVTCYLVKMPSKYLELAVDILGDMVLYPNITQVDIDKERTVILEEIKMYKDQPHSFAAELLDKLIWINHPLGMSVLGTNESVTSINRKDILDYKNKSYSASNVVISAAGDVEHDKLVDIVKNKFSKLNKGIENNYSNFKVNQKVVRHTVFNKDTEQSHLLLGFHGFKRNHPLKYAMGILHILLGANSSSRLFNEVREKRGLAYEIGTQVKFLKDTGVFVVHAGVDNQKVVATIKLVLSELERIKLKKVTSGELKRAKEFYLGQLMLALEDTMDQMFWIGEPTTTLNKIFHVDEIIKEVEKVNIDSLQEVSNTIFKQDKMNFAVVGPLEKQKEDIIKTLKIK